MKKLILLALAAAMAACAQTPTNTTDCTCTFGGKKYAIRQNARGAVYGVPAQ